VSLPQLIFDEDCGFCSSAASWGARNLARGDGTDAEVVPWQLLDPAAVGAAMVARAQREVLWVTADGVVHGGAAAVASWLGHRGGPYRLPGWIILSATPTRQVAEAVYRLVARHRHQLPGGTPACWT
jgi:predicted DCC family thiol-disulfide oxidoreductase YuxK